MCFHYSTDSYLESTVYVDITVVVQLAVMNIICTIAQISCNNLLLVWIALESEVVLASKQGTLSLC